MIKGGQWRNWETQSPEPQRRAIVYHVLLRKLTRTVPSYQFKKYIPMEGHKIIPPPPQKKKIWLHIPLVGTKQHTVLEWHVTECKVKPNFAIHPRTPSHHVKDISVSSRYDTGICHHVFISHRWNLASVFYSSSFTQTSQRSSTIYYVHAPMRHTLIT